MSARKTQPKSASPTKGGVAAKRNGSGMTSGAATVAAYFAQQAPEKRALLEKLRALVMKSVPDAEASIKWGVPFYQRNGKSICALAVFKEHVGINFFAPPELLTDPDHKLEGAGKANRMLKVRTAGDIDAASIARWLKAAVAANG